MPIDYSEWIVGKKMRVANLLLDPRNPRIPGASDTLEQHELIAELLNHDDVLGLAQVIVDKGFYPHESLVAIQQGGRHYVIEGNRRLAALKVLLSPDAAPDDFQKTLRRLATQVDTRSISSVSVTVAPSRDAALPLILERHTHTRLERWSPAMQAKFFRDLVGEGYSLSEIGSMAGLPQSKVQEALRTDALYRAACALDLEEDVKVRVTNPRKFPVSTLERAFESEAVREFLGVRPDQKEVFRINVARAEFLKGFRRLVVDIATGEADSRVMHDTDKVQEYLAKFGGDRPNLKKRGQFGISEIISEPKPDEQPPSQSPKKPNRIWRESKSLIPSGLRCEVESPRIRAIFVELKSLPVAKYENATALLLRTLLDLSVTNYLEKTGRITGLLAHFQKKDKKSRDWSPSLRQQLSYLLESDPPEEIQGQALAALKRFTSDKAEQLCLDALDKFTHNKYSPPVAAELRGIWTTLDPLMRVLLRDPQ